MWDRPSDGNQGANQWWKWLRLLPAALIIVPWAVRCQERNVQIDEAVMTAFHALPFTGSQAERDCVTEKAKAGKAAATGRIFDECLTKEHIGEVLGLASTAEKTPVQKMCVEDYLVEKLSIVQVLDAVKEPPNYVARGLVNVVVEAAETSCGVITASTTTTDPATTSDLGTASSSTLG